MKTLFLPSFLLLAGSLLMATSPVSAETDAITVTVLTTFDYPGGYSTYPAGINNAGDIAGYFVKPNAAARGFIRLNTGALSRPIMEPNGPYITRAFGINQSRTVAGDYEDSNESGHGYLLSGGVADGTYTTFDFPGTSGSYLSAINDAGDFAGAGANGTRVDAYVSIGGTSRLIPISGSAFSIVHALNNLGQAVGHYQASIGLVSHGFFVNANGAVTAPVDYPGAVGTILEGISDKGLVVGRYTGTDGVDHAFLLRLPDTFVSYDYPGATATSFNGVNVRGMISAHYLDASGVAHGFIAQASEDGAH